MLLQVTSVYWDWLQATAYELCATGIAFLCRHLAFIHCLQKTDGNYYFLCCNKEPIYILHIHGTFHKVREYIETNMIARIHSGYEILRRIF
jgi:hypothetical protein